MRRHNIQHLLLLVLFIALIGSPVATLGQQEDGKQAPSQPPELPESAIYKVRKTKPGQQPEAQQLKSFKEAQKWLENKQPQTQQQPKVPPRQSGGIAPPQKPPSKQTSPQRSPQTERSTFGQDPAQHPLTERYLSRKLGSKGLQQLLGQLESMETEAATGRGAPMADRWFDNAGPRTGNDDVLRPSGTRFFTGVFVPTTVQDAKASVDRYGSQGGGIVLEGTATGLADINDVQYDKRFNAFIVDDRAVYFVRVPPKTVAVLCRAIDQDEKERVGVSLGQGLEGGELLYGKVPKDSALAWDLKIADNFLGDIVFGWNHWTAGYRFANGFRPEPSQGDWNGCVYFVFTASKFAIQQEEVRLSKANLKVTLVPLSQLRAKDGGFLPDYDAIPLGRIPQQYELNANNVAKNISYYRRERIIDRMFAYSELAAFIRTLKQAGFDLEDLANNIPGAGHPVPGEHRAAINQQNALNDHWAKYLKEIEADNAYPNWPGPPYDLYQRIQKERLETYWHRQFFNMLVFLLIILLMLCLWVRRGGGGLLDWPYSGDKGTPKSVAAPPLLSRVPYIVTAPVRWLNEHVESYPVAPKKAKEAKKLAAKESKYSESPSFISKVSYIVTAPARWLSERVESYPIAPTKSNEAQELAEEETKQAIVDRIALMLAEEKEKRAKEEKIAPEKAEGQGSEELWENLRKAPLLGEKISQENGRTVIRYRAERKIEEPRRIAEEETKRIKTERIAHEQAETERKEKEDLEQAASKVHHAEAALSKAILKNLAFTSGNYKWRRVEKAQEARDKAVREFFEALHEGDSRVSWNVVWLALGLSSELQTIEPLIARLAKMVQSEESKIRLEAVEALRYLAEKTGGLTGYPRAMELLIYALNDKDQQVVKKAAGTLHDYCVKWRPSKELQRVLWAAGIIWWPRGWYQKLKIWFKTASTSSYSSSLPTYTGTPYRHIH